MSVGLYMIDVSYAAGFIDGEGCLSLYPQGKSYIPRITVVNAHVEILDSLAELLGGKVFARKSADNHTPTSALVIHQRDEVLNALDLLIPYLVIKKEQAIAMKELLESRIERCPKRGQNVPYSEKELSLAVLVRKLNTRYSKKGTELCLQ